MLTNAGSQHIEVWASTSSEGAEDWEPIVPKAVFRTEAEIKEGKARERPRTYTTETGLKKRATEAAWARIRVMCSWCVLHCIWTCMRTQISFLKMAHVVPACREIGSMCRCLRCAEACWWRSEAEAMVHFDHLGADGRHSAGLMGLAKVRVWHGLDCEPPPPAAQPAVEAARVTAASTPKPAARDRGHATASAHATVSVPKPVKPSSAAHKSGQSAVRASSVTALKNGSSADAARALGADRTPPTSHRLQPSPRFAHWSSVTKKTDPNASKSATAHASASSFRGASAARNIRNACQNPATAGAGLVAAAASSHASRNVQASGKADAVEQELAKRLAVFVDALPAEKLETTTSKDAKSAVMRFFDDWDGVWKAHKHFFR